MALVATLPSTAAVGGLTSDGVEHVRHVQGIVHPFGARMHDGYYYVFDQQGLHIFDTRDPASPRRVGGATLPKEPVFNGEDLDTNGRIAIQTIGGDLWVFNVANKAAPRILAFAAGGGGHTVSCLLDCTWSYGSGGEIVDLRNPARPITRRERWWPITFEKVPHDVTEVAPGMVLVSADPMVLLDATDPLAPRVVATGTYPGMGAATGAVHSALWPRGATDRFALSSEEAFITGRCLEPAGPFVTWDTAAWRDTGQFVAVDRFTLGNGTYTDGSPAANVEGCSLHWFEPHPTFHDGGVVAIAAYEHGTRFLRVSPTGMIDEVGWFLPFGGETNAVHWVNHEVLYAIDYARGFDVLRFTGATS